ncbi:Hypothetical protein D9617_2g059920 [Elsinoe fawcettii]|nr:Hypothetical protein D9617_2g059920 [Elsinoe fawcettii]
MAAHNINDETIIALVSLVIMIAMTAAGWIVTKRLMERNQNLHAPYRGQADLDDGWRLLERLLTVWAGTGEVTTSQDEDVEWGIRSREGQELYDISGVLDRQRPWIAPSIDEIL